MTGLLGLFADVRKDAAVHIKDVAVDKVGGIGSEEDGGAHQILSLAPAGSGGLGYDELIEGWRLPSGWRSRSGAVCGVAM